MSRPEDVINTPAADSSNGPPQSPGISMRGRLRRPFQKRVIVYNREDKSMEVMEDSPEVLEELKKKDCKIVSLPRGQSEVAIFVDPETQSEPTTDQQDSKGHSNLFLVKLHLDRLGTLDRLLHYFGLITSVYVINPPPQRSGLPSHSLEN